MLPFVLTTPARGARMIFGFNSSYMAAPGFRRASLVKIHLDANSCLCFSGRAGSETLRPRRTEGRSLDQPSDRLTHALQVVSPSSRQVADELVRRR